MQATVDRHLLTRNSRWCSQVGRPCRRTNPRCLHNPDCTGRSFVLSDLATTKLKPLAPRDSRARLLKVGGSSAAYPCQPQVISGFEPRYFCCPWSRTAPPDHKKPIVGSTRIGRVFKVMLPLCAECGVHQVKRHLGWSSARGMNTHDAKRPRLYPGRTSAPA
jgi:hypothetical protein